MDPMGKRHLFCYFKSSILTKKNPTDSRTEVGDCARRFRLVLGELCHLDQFLDSILGEGSCGKKNGHEMEPFFFPLGGDQTSSKCSNFLRNLCDNSGLYGLFGSGL